LTIGLDEHKGLMELIVLNIGLELKVLTPEVFTMMVIMALVTTFMTGPALDLINYLFKSKVVPDAEEITNQSKYRILFSFGNNEKSPYCD
jgi:Kef-type K+ transport system membrane component KefB